MVRSLDATLEEVATRWGTPAFLIVEQRICDALSRLNQIDSPIPVRHWLSCKTLPLQPFLSSWLSRGDGIEVVSDFELDFAIREGFAPEKIVVNGTAKHRWLSDFDAPGLNVQFDSLTEIDALGALAAARRWSVGIRLHTSENLDPDDSRYFDQFGISLADLPGALQRFAKHALRVERVGFHLRSNLRNVEPYLAALSEVAAACYANQMTPRVLDIGGGLPACGEIVDGVDGAEFDLNEMSRVFARCPDLLPAVHEVWLENGRFITSEAGHLLLRVWDVKRRSDVRYLICDGGRVNHALPSDWQRHRISPLPRRNGDLVTTVVCGPTCMAYDVLARMELPADIGQGDLLDWQNAGAYHISWETRFSFGLAPIVWLHNDGRLSLVRAREARGDWRSI